MNDTVDFFEKLSDHWLEYKSIPFASMFMILLGGALVSFFETKEAKLYIVCLLICLLAIYSLFCVLSDIKEKRKASAESGVAAGHGKKRAAIIACIALVFLIMVSGTVMFASGLVSKDGNYVIWVDEYQIAVSPGIHKNFYLSGLPVEVHGGKLDEYPRQCVFELDFKSDDTFTISYGGKLIGVVPGKNGVGFSDSNTAVLWKLEEAGNGVYYILNVDGNTYLQWLDSMNNWTTHGGIIEEYRSQFMHCLERID